MYKELIITCLSDEYRIDSRGRFCRMQGCDSGLRTKVLDDAFTRGVLEKKVWNIDSKGYAYTGVNKKPKRLHQIIYEHYNHIVLNGQLIDHIDWNKLNNTPENLRLVSHQTNRHHQRKQTGKHLSSRYIGVCYDKRTNKWRARITENGKDILSKRFNSEIEAAKAVNAAYKIFRPLAAIPNPEVEVI